MNLIFNVEKILIVLNIQAIKDQLFVLLLTDIFFLFFLAFNLLLGWQL